MDEKSIISVINSISCLSVIQTIKSNPNSPLYESIQQFLQNWNTIQETQNTLLVIQDPKKADDLSQGLQSSLILSQERPKRDYLALVIPGLIPELENWKNEKKEFYDEVYLPTGEMRAHWSDIISVALRIEANEPERISEFLSLSKRSFGGDNTLYHIPRVLHSEEHGVLLMGVQQRGRAIQAFLLDHYQNSFPNYFSSKIIAKKVMKQILFRSAEENIQQLPHSWGFWYGPDIVRGPDGSFFVCEDNIGYVGGFGDLVCARNTLTQNFPEYIPFLPAHSTDPKQFYERLSKYYFSKVQPKEKVILLHYPKRMTQDNEERRVKMLFKKNGIISVEIPTGKRKKSKSLVVANDGVYLCYEKRKSGMERKFKVGLVIIDAEPFDVDPKDNTVNRKLLMDEVKYWLEHYKEILEKIPPNVQGKKAIVRASAQLKLEKINYLLESKRLSTWKLSKFLKKTHREDILETLNQGVEGLLDAYYSGKVQIINGPGMDFLGDKLFCTFVDKLVEFYLKEKPILKSIPTMSFSTLISIPVFEAESPLPKLKLSKEERFSQREKRKVDRAEKRMQRIAEKKERLEKKKTGKLTPINSTTTSQSSSLNKQLYEQIFDIPEVQQFVVVKRVDGRGGDSVWVGPKITREVFLQAKDEVLKEPEAFIVQKYISLSQVDGQIVDL